MERKYSTFSNISVVVTVFFIVSWTLFFVVPDYCSADVDISVTKTGTPQSALTGELVTYTIDVTVPVTGAVTGTIVLTDTLPGGLSYSIDPLLNQGWQCNLITTTVPYGQTGQVSCTRPISFGTGSTYPLMIVGTVETDSSASVKNTVEVTYYGDSDPDWSNNSDSASTDLNQPAIPTLSEWGTLLFSLLLAAFAIAYLRKSRKA